MKLPTVELGGVKARNASALAFYTDSVCSVPAYGRMVTPFWWY
jgi:hypothetical protein